MPKDVLLATRDMRCLSWLGKALARYLPAVTAAVVIWLVGIHLAWIPDTSVTRAVTLAALTLALLITATDWHSKASARLGLSLLVVVAGLGSVTTMPFSPVAGAGAFDTVIFLLLGIGVLRAYLEKQNIAAVIERALSHPQLAERPRALFLLYGGMTFFLSLAVVPMVGTLTRKTALNHRQHLRIAMRAVGATMFLLPTTVGAAAVSVMFPTLPWKHTLLMGLPLALATGLLTRRGAPLDPQSNSPPVGGTADSHVGLPIGLFVGMLMLSQGVLEHSTVTSVALALTVSGMGSITYRYGVGDAIEAVQGTIRRSGAEILLFLACGTLQAALAGLEMSRTALLFPPVTELLASTPLYTIVVIGVLPLLTILSIHPMILFAGLFPLLHPFASFGPAAEYLIWIAMFVVAQLVSPVSISAVTAAASIGAAPWTVSLASHGRFALVFTMLCVAYFSTISISGLL